MQTYRLHKDKDGVLANLSGTLDYLMEFINKHPDMVNIKKSTIGTEAVHLMTKDSNIYNMDFESRMEALDRLARSTYHQGLKLSDSLYVITTTNGEYSFVFAHFPDALEDAVGFAAEWSGWKLKKLDYEKLPPKPEAHTLPPEVLKNLKVMSERTGHSVQELIELACRNYYTAFDIFGDLVKWPSSAQ